MEREGPGEGATGRPSREPALVFLLSPADCGGKRAQTLRASTSAPALGAALDDPEGVPLGELFTFISSLYFRGKLAYARRFARPGPDGNGVYVVTPSRGLLAPDARVSRTLFDEFARASIGVGEVEYRRPLAASAKRVADGLEGDDGVVLLGSLATPKYLEPLTAAFGRRLRVPERFVGLGNMSRGSLLLQCVAESRELEYVDAAATVGE